MKFDIAISIGMNCQCRYNISRTLYCRTHGSSDGFSLGEHEKIVEDYGSHFFDWSVTPIDSLIKILDINFHGVLKLENLEIKKIEGAGQTVLDLATGCWYPHIFPELHSGKLTHQNLVERYPKISEKFTYLINKTKALLASDKNILFVLTGNFPAVKVLRAMELLRFYTSNFRVIYTPWKNKPGYQGINFDALIDDCLIVRPIQHKAYPGDLASWDDVFQGIELQIPSRPY